MTFLFWLKRRGSTTEYEGGIRRSIPDDTARTNVQLCELLLAAGLQVELHMLLEPRTFVPRTSVPRTRLELRILALHMPLEPRKLEPRMQLERCRPNWHRFGLSLLTVFWLIW